ncbi:ABC transporter ATP-binding protein [Archaeoglobales archaeon]|nr:MAG: ABC transporter ATP-binding protein [Archaeoglobales archaeon]
MEPIVVRGLTKTFNGFKAVDSVSFSVKRGEIFGLLGPNGAGKTTTIKMLVTLLKPSSGEAKVAGYDVVKQSNMVRKNIGIVFQEPTLDLELTAKENLDFHARLYGIERGRREERIEEVLKLVDLYDKAKLQVKKFSGGMQRRLEIARGLLHFPKVLFLDEPTLGLDAQTRRRIWDYILEMREREDVTIILTTHYIEEADKLCDRVAIIDKGRIIALDKPENLKKRVGEDVISLVVNDAKKLAMELELEEIHKIVRLDDRLELSVYRGESTIPRIIEIAQKVGIEVKAVSLRKPTLEDVFIHLTGREIREEGRKNLFWMRR